MFGSNYASNPRDTEDTLFYLYSPKRRKVILALQKGATISSFSTKVMNSESEEYYAKNGKKWLIKKYFKKISDKCLELMLIKHYALSMFHQISKIKE